LTARIDENEKKKAWMASGRQSSSNPKAQVPATSKNSNLQILRNKSPTGGAFGRPELVNASGDFAAQAGIKIYSDIKQITATKKREIKKLSVNCPPRQNIIQRNVARSTGARSGSNNGKGTNQNLLNENNSVMAPVLNPPGQRNNSSNPKKEAHNSMVLINDQRK